MPRVRVRTIGKFSETYNRELTMKRLAFAVGVLALAFAAATPARADFAVVKFELGFCRIWWSTDAKPWGSSYTILAKAPDFASAWEAQADAVKNGKCR